MSRFLSEHQIDAAGTRIELSVHSIFKKVFKVSNYFVLLVEVMDSEASATHAVDIVIKRHSEYLNPKAKYIDSVLVGSQLFHFFAQPAALEDKTVKVVQNSVLQQNPKAPPMREEDRIASKK